MNMKYKYLLHKVYCTFFLFLLFCLAHAQIATYPLRSGTLTPANPGIGNPYPSSTGLTSANVTASIVNVGSEITNTPNGTMNSTGLRVKPNTLAWPTSINNGFCVNVPISPKANYDFVLTSVTFKNSALDNTPNLWCQLAYQANGLGNWVNIGAPQAVTAANLGSTITIGGLNEGFYNGNAYIFRLFFYGNGANDKNQGFRIADLVFNGTTSTPPALNPTVHTTGVSGTGFYSTDAAGTYDIGTGFRIVNKAGFLCGTNSSPTFANATPTYVATLGSPMNATISGLTPGVSYYVRAFAITQTDTILANVAEVIFVKTNNPQEPLINTLPPTMATVVKATTGGWGIDSAGQSVLEKGILYSTNPVMTYPATTHTSDGKGNADFYTKINNLQPNTKYYVMAYARNSIGVGYGNLDSITTPAATPYIAVVPGNLDFGDIVYNSAATVLSYKLTAGNLNPSSGVITLNATNGYSICSTYNGTYSNTLNLAYSSGGVSNKIIYVKTRTNSYGVVSGIITHNGGGVAAPNADTVFLNTNVTQNQDTLSNMGTDFWAGFGCQEKMSQNTSWSDTATGSAQGAHLTLYIAAGSQAANVVVEMPGITGANTFPRTISIPANSVGIVNGFPIPTNDPKNTTNSADSRLYYTGVSSRGIHIYSTNGAPVACWLYDWATNNSAAGSMLFPTNTWNSSYSVQTYGNDKSNTGDPSSYFFVVAAQDSTPITFTPTADIIDSASSPIITGNPGGTILYAKNVAHPILLKKKGDVFNALGLISSSTNIAQDLTGTKVSTTCDKKIAVFGGNSRTLISTANCGSVSSGSDNLIQQMFPSVAWGTKYLTVPTKTMEYNLFRITVSDPVTKVWVDNVLYTTASPRWNATGKFYAIEGNQPHLITSDLPVSVTQYILPGTYCGGASVGNNGPGDPEMLLLSPIQQAIKSTTVYCPDFKNGNSGAGYLNVIIHKSGIDSFKLDNKIYSSTVDTGTSSYSGTPYGSSGAVLLRNAFVKHPLDTNYRYAKFKVSYPATHTMSSTVAFNAIAYGTANGESWGYNAGTAINNLSAVNISINPNGTDTSSSSIKTVKDNLVYLQIAIPYDTTTINSVIWDAQGNANVTPNTPQTGIINPSTLKPVCMGTIVKDGRTFYIYQSPIQYTFSELGAYKIKVTFSGTFVSDCGGTDTKYINVIVGKDDIAFSYTRTPAGDCISKTIALTDNSTGFAGTTIHTYIWSYGDASKNDTVKNTASSFPYPSPNSHTYPANDTFWLKLTTINSVGGVTTDSIKVDLRLITAPTFSISKDSVCPKENVVFTNLTSAGADKWFWDYGDGSPVDSTTSNTPVSHSYTKEGVNTVAHWIKNSAGCPSSITKDTVFVLHKPIADFVLPSGVCVPGLTLFTNTSDTAVGLSSMPYTYRWDFGVLDSTSDTSNLKNPSYKYTRAPGVGEYNVSLTTTSKYGCVSDVKTQLVNNVYAKPTAAIASTSSKKVCAGGTANFFDGSTATGQTVNSWYWNFGDGGTATTQNPTYSGYTNNLLYTVKLAVGTNKGCISDTATWTIKVNPKPIAKTILPSSCITSGSLLFQDTSVVAIDDSIQKPYSYTWNFGDNANIYTTKDSTHTYAGIGTYIITHSITTANGCADTHKDTFTISGTKPNPNYTVNSRVPQPNNHLCNNDTIVLTDNSTIAIGTIKKVVIYWDTSALRFPGLSTNPTIDNSPQNGVMPITAKQYKFKYPYSHLSKSPVIRILTYNSDSCYSEAFVNITLFGIPKIVFDTIRGMCVNDAPKKINLAYDSTGRFDQTPSLVFGGKPTYSGNGVYNDSMFNPSTAGVGTPQIKVVYELTSPFFNHCRDSAYAPIAVWDIPKPAFTVSTPACEKNSVTFTDATPLVSGTGNNKNWKWHFGEPSSGANDSAVINPAKHIYAASGIYNVTLSVTSDSGCVGTMATPVPVLVNPLPKVSFTPPSGTCPGSPSYFTSTSTISDGSTLSYLWNFGDTVTGNINTSTLNPAPHTYGPTGATDSIRLIVTSSNGCKDSVVKILGSLPNLPIIIPSYKIDGVVWDTNTVKKVCLGTPLNFSTSFRANDYSWSFGDSAGVTNKGTPVLHTYASVNSFTGSFTTIDSNGCQTRSVPIKVEVVGLPNVDFIVGNPTCEKNAISFTNATTPGSGATSITSWLWNFGDPASGAKDSSKVKDTIHTYNVYAKYNVSLTAVNDNGCKATIATPKVVNVYPKPTPKLVAPASVCLPDFAIFKDSSTIADGTALSSLWNFGDPASGANNTSGANPANHYYTAIPTDSVKLIVTSVNGCKDSMAIKISAGTFHPKPSAAYSVANVVNATPQVCSGTAVAYKDASATTPTANYWIWGDNGLVVETGSPKSHTYTSTTTQLFIGKHFIDDVNGCRSDSIDVKTQIWALPTPVIEVVNPTCQKQDVQFNDKSTTATGSGTVNKWDWTFGDIVNNTSILQNPTHTYNTVNTYNVVLTVTSDKGCKATSTPVAVSIHPKPNADFVMQDTTCLPAATTFTSTSTVADGSTPTAYFWSFGDAASGVLNNSTSNPTSHIYPSAANYNVQLIVTSNNGCKDTTKNKVLNASSLHNQPIALYTVNTTSHDTPRVCLGNSITFKDASSNVKTSYWVWGDNGSVVELGTNPAPQFGTTAAGIYYGQHYIDDNFGCRSFIDTIVTIIDDLPTVKGEVRYVMANTPNILKPTITGATSQIWKVTNPLGLLTDYLDDNTAETPICTPLTDVTYLITVSNDGGCKDTASYYVRLLKTPVIPTAFSPNGDGINDKWEIKFLNEYVGATVQVFDRYGQIVLNKFGYSSPWNGKLNNNGADLPTGVYYYIIKPGSGMPLMTGYVTILR